MLTDPNAVLAEALNRRGVTVTADILAEIIHGLGFTLLDVDHIRALGTDFARRVKDAAG